MNEIIYEYIIVISDGVVSIPESFRGLSVQVYLLERSERKFKELKRTVKTCLRMFQDADEANKALFEAIKLL